MVNAEATKVNERRERDRAPASHAAGLGVAKLNPFGDLHTLQHLSARLARGLRGVFEPLLRQEIRAWAEPLVVQRFADYRAERADALTAWLPMAMNAPHAGGAHALCVVDGRFVLELLDQFFGGTGAAPAVLPAEFSPAAEALVARLGTMVAVPLRAAWEPLTRIDFVPTRVGIAAGNAKPVFLDLLYPVAALKPHAPTLTGKVLDKAEADPAWRNELTRSVMNVRFPIRSVLAEPMVPLQTLIDLKPGDVIPISFAADVPVMVGKDRLGTGTVGISNGFAAVRMTAIAHLDQGHDQ